MSLLRFALMAMLSLLGTLAWAAEPAEKAPKPRTVEAVPLEMSYPAYFRHSHYDVWLNYGVDRRGNFRPLVVYSPYQPYYLYNGAPFPFSITRSTEFVPTMTGTPYRAKLPDLMPYCPEE